MTKFDKIVLEPLATPYLAFIPVTAEEVQAEMDEYWEAHKEIIVKQSNYKGRKQEGGKVDYKAARKYIEEHRGLSTIYGYTFALMGQEKIQEELGRDVMLVNSAVYNTTKDPMLFLNLYFYPTITFEKGLNLQIPKLNLSSFEAELSGRMLDLRLRHKVLKKAEIIDDTSEVVIDVKALKNGEAYLPETIKNYRRSVQDIELPEVAKSLVGKVSGSVYELEEKRGEDDYKHIVSILEVYSVDFLDESDPALFEGEGVKSIEEFKEKVKADFERNSDARIREYVYTDLMNQIISEGLIEPVPQRFVDLAVESVAKKHGSDDNSVKQQIADTVLRDVVQEMAKNWYKKTYNLPKTMSFTEITDDMLKRVEFL